MKINTFEEIISWLKWKDLALSIYSAFLDIKDYWFKDQI